MLNTKNISPKQIAAITAVAIALIGAAVNYIFYRTWWIPLASFSLLFFISFLLVDFFMQRFIYRKIKLIYKFIQQTKASKREEFFYKNILPQKSMEEVSEDVEKWAEQKREEIELLKRNEAFRREFLQNFSHELKTPIFAIQGYVDTLLSGAMHQEEVNKKFLENTSRNVDRLVNLVDDLDEISKLESGRQLLNFSNFVIQDLVKEVFDALQIKSSSRNIKTQIKKGCEQPIIVYADKEKIRQVLINLTDNAIKYGKNQGNITFSVYRTDDKHVLAEISDDGYGISEEHLPRIFERFYRTDLARSRKEGGSGLGLSICKHIIEAHGQSIHARSTVDVGSTFGFTLETDRK